ncbi:magnesium chelatase subunit H [Candidatus Oscillochloris fontis]|uniref:magnesium chelatase subunit H n=1 Tax=Candidatus Oscillochloris fontis TaxID=2496868 RepID=UPI00237BA629|nr:magnesium chelatase subunit H [Candidatus Oscillochloris fontis]
MLCTTRHEEIMRFVFLTLDGNHAAALRQAADRVRREHGVTLTVAFHDASSLRDPAGWRRLEQDLSGAAFIFGARLFGEEYVRPLEKLLRAAPCPVLIITSNPALIHCTHIGKFDMRQRDEDEKPGLMQQWIKKLRPQGGAGEARRQLAVLRNLSKVLKIIPGKARDIYAFAASHQYWLNPSPENLYRMLCMLADVYVPGMHGKLPQADPLSYPETALFHPDAPQPFERLADYDKWLRGRKPAAGTRKPALKPGDVGTVGVIALRGVVLSGNTAHLKSLIHALEARGLAVRLAYASGLDQRPAVETFFRADKKHAQVDLLINATGFSLVGGPAESRPVEARETLRQLDVGYVGLVPLTLQRIDDWRADATGLVPVQAALSVAIPELEGAAEPLVFCGPSGSSDGMFPLDAEISQIADRAARRVALRHKPNAQKKLALVIFNYPPNLGNVGTAAYLDVFQSLYELLRALKSDGYTVEVPASADELRRMIVEGNALANGTDSNVAARLPVNDYRKLFPAETEIEPFWGRAPGELLNDGANFYILGRQLGNVFIGVQPSFGYERDPMRLLMAKDASPNHAFAAFYAWLRYVYGADAVVHFGTHGALEFMPGKQVGMGATCWPSRLIGELPNFYYYSVNNPSEAAIAKRRSAATLVSYLVPPLQQAGLYKGLRTLKDTLDRYRSAPDAELLEDVRTQAEKLGMTAAFTPDRPDAYVGTIGHELLQIEERMIPSGLHVLGKSPVPAELVDFLALTASFRPATRKSPATFPALVAASVGYDYAALRERITSDAAAQEQWRQVETICKEAIRQFVLSAPGDRHHRADLYLRETAGVAPGSLNEMWTFLGDLLAKLLAPQEVQGLLHGLRGGFIQPSPSNDVVRDPGVLPTGRNVYSLDPYRVPSTAAMERAGRLVNELLARLVVDQGALPQTVAIVLWGSDNLKSDCEGVGQVLWLYGARPVVDELGNVTDVALIPLEELGRPRVDAVVTVSGIFRDLLGNQMQLIDKAARLAALADEPAEQNFVRAHAVAQAAELQIPVEEAAARVFSNAPGSYGANVNNLVDSGTWDDDTQLGEAFLSRKSFSLGTNGQWRESRAVLEKALGTVDASFQNIDSFEVGLSDIDNYYDNLGGITKSVEILRGSKPKTMVADALGTNNRVSSLDQAVRMETRAKLLNPKWYEAMLSHGYEGAREIEARVNNTYGWSATAGAVDSWVYQSVAETFVLDEAMRERLAALNPTAAVGVVRRLLESSGRGFWDADPETLDRLREIYADLEDRLEGIAVDHS